MKKSHPVSSVGSWGPDISELNLIGYSQHGDRDAFACLYGTYIDRIHRYIYYRVYDREVAEDLTSLVFLRVWENLGSFKIGCTPFTGWLYRIAHNAVIDYYRAHKTLVPLEDCYLQQLGHSDGVDEKVDVSFLSQRLVKAMDALTHTQQEVLILRFIWGLTTREIACRLHKGQGAIRALQTRGLRKLSQDPDIHTGLLYGS
jgi:RNA polymerase sigma-70 factor (ECF subfamily)